MKNRILKRPMFRMGGDVENTGIMDGMRQRYAESSPEGVQPKREPMLFRPSMNDFLIQFGLDLASRPPGGNIFQTGLASLVPGLQSSDIRTLGSVGAVQQAQNQAVLDAQREANRLAAFEPYERLNTFGSGIAQIMSGYPGRSQFTSVPNPTPLQTALGVGSTLSGIYGNIMGPVRIR